MDESPLDRWERCWKCGYALRGLPREGVCPECGVHFEIGHDPSRCGSAWQGERSVRAWLDTNWRTLRHPVSRWDELNPIGRAPSYLAASNIIVASSLWALGWLFVLALSSGGRFDVSRTASCFAAGVVVALLCAGLGAVGHLTLYPRPNFEHRGYEGCMRALVLSHASVAWFALLPAGAAYFLASIVYMRTGGGRDVYAWFIIAPLGMVVQPLLAWIAFILLAWLGKRRTQRAKGPEVT